jgi:hypothetical protein
LDERRDANHLALIRSFLIDSGQSRGLHAPNCAKNYCVAFAPHDSDIIAKINAQARDFRSCARLAAQCRYCKKSLFYRAFCNAREMRARHRCAFAQRNIARDERSIERARHASRASRTHIVKWSQCFFHCSVVNGVQCASIPGRTDATPAMLHG